MQKTFEVYLKKPNCPDIDSCGANAFISTSWLMANTRKLKFIRSWYLAQIYTLVDNISVQDDSGHWRHPKWCFPLMTRVNGESSMAPKVFKLRSPFAHQSLNKNYIHDESKLRNTTQLHYYKAQISFFNVIIQQCTLLVAVAHLEDSNNISYQPIKCDE